MNAASLDTTVLVRFVTKDIPDLFAAAIELLGKEGSTYEVSDTCIVEFAYALENHYQWTREQISEAIRSVLTIDTIRANGSLFDEVCTAYVSHPKLSFTYCYLAQNAVRAGKTPLYTFDKKLANQHPGAQLIRPGA